MHESCQFIERNKLIFIIITLFNSHLVLKMERSSISKQIHKGMNKRINDLNFELFKKANIGLMNDLENILTQDLNYGEDLLQNQYCGPTLDSAYFS